LQGLGTLNAIKYMEMRAKQNKRFVQKIHADFMQVKTVYYEDLLYNKQETLNNIFQFLEVKPHTVQPSNYKKIVDDDLKKAIHNYDWVHKILSHTPYINYFYKNDVTLQDLETTKNKLIQFYENLDVHLPASPKNNTYHHQLQIPLSLTDKQVDIFRKLNQYYHNKLKWLSNEKKDDPYTPYKIQMFNNIKQLEVKLFLGDEKYKRKWEFDKTYKPIQKPVEKQASSQKK